MTALDGLKEARRLVELRERVEKATGPDRELDEMICRALNVWHVYQIRNPYGPGQVEKKQALFYTASIDAALALVERVLPEWTWLLESGGDGDFGCTLRPGDGSQIISSDWLKSNAPLAILSALLRALAEADAGHSSQTGAL